MTTDVSRHVDHGGCVDIDSTRGGCMASGIDVDLLHNSILGKVQETNVDHWRGIHVNSTNGGSSRASSVNVDFLDYSVSSEVLESRNISSEVVENINVDLLLDNVITGMKKVLKTHVGDVSSKDEHYKIDYKSQEIIN